MDGALLHKRGVRNTNYALVFITQAHTSIRSLQDVMTNLYLQLMNGQRKPIEEAETFRQFLFNRQNGTVLGRTAKSWGEYGSLLLLVH